MVISIDNTILNVALPTIVRTLHATSSQLQWVVDAYAVTFAGLLLTVGSLGDRFGRKVGVSRRSGGLRLRLRPCCMVGIARQADHCPDRDGGGGRGIDAFALSILVNVFPEENDKRRAIGIWSGAAGVGVAAGPIFGGLLLSRYWWGSVFLINVPICLLGAIATVLLVPNSRNPTGRKSDPVGACLSIVALGLLLWGIIEATNLGWTSPTILGSLAAAAVTILVFVIWEHRSNSPMLPVSSSPTGASALRFPRLPWSSLLFWGCSSWSRSTFKFSLGYSPFATGIRIGPIAATLLLVAPLSVLLAHRFGTKAVVAVGLALVALGLVLLSRTSIATTYFGDLPALLLLAAGAGLVMAPCTESVMGSVPLSDAGVGSATNDTAMQIGGALGVAVLGTFLNSRYQDHMRVAISGHAVPHPIEQVILGSIGGALGVSQHLPGHFGSGLADLARQSFVSGMDLALLLAAGAIVIASLVVVSSLPSRQRRSNASVLTQAKKSEG